MSYRVVRCWPGFPWLGWTVTKDYVPPTDPTRAALVKMACDEPLTRAEAELAAAHLNRTEKP